MNEGEKLLKEYVSLLAEDFGMVGGAGADIGGADWAGWNYGLGGGRGGGFGYEGEGGALLNIFVKPFTDVFQTVVGKTKEMSIRTQTFLKVSLEALQTAFIPLLTDDFDEIFAREKQDLDKLQQKYGDVYRATHEAFKHPDFILSTFLYSPETMLTIGAAKLTPPALAGIMNVLTGDRLHQAVRKVKDTDVGGTVMNLLKQASVLWAGGKKLDREELAKDFLGKLPGNWLESRIVEKKSASTMTDVKNVMNVLRSLFDDVASSPRAKEIQRDVHAAVNKALSSSVRLAKKVGNAKDVQGLAKSLRLGQSVLQKFQGIPENERQAVEQKFIVAVKNASKEIIAKPLKHRVEMARKAGHPENSPYVIAHVEAIKQIDNVLS